MAKAKLKQVPVVQPLRLDLGCGPNKRGPEWIGVDTLAFDGKVDRICDLRQTPWVLSHIAIPEKPRIALDPIYKFRGEYSDGRKWYAVPGADPIASDSVDEVHCSHFLEHLTGAERVPFFNELYRVMRKDAKATIITPHWSSGRAYGDLTHQWPPVVEMFWYYLDKNWRAANAPHVGLNCDFLATWGYSVAPEWQVRNQETQMFGINHYREVAQDMCATIVKRA